MKKFVQLLNPAYHDFKNRVMLVAITGSLVFGFCSISYADQLQIWADGNMVEENKYWVPVPHEGDWPVTVSGYGTVDPPPDFECLVCPDDSSGSAPDPDGDPRYTFSYSLGEQEGDGPDINISVQQGTAPDYYQFQLTNVEQDFKCPPDLIGGSTMNDNSDASDEITLVVAKASISSSSPTDKIICNTVGFFNMNGNEAFIYVNVAPSGESDLLRAYVDLNVDLADPDTDDKGSIKNRDLFLELGSPFIYDAKSETQNDKCASSKILQDQKVTLKLYLGSEEADQIDITVRSAFNYLAKTKSDFATAIDFVNAKYSIGQAATYDPSLGDYGSTQALLGTVRVGPIGVDSENVLASTLIHENVHVNQGALMRVYASQGEIFWNLRGGRATPAADYTTFERNCIDIRCNSELAAYYTELANISRTCLDRFEHSVVTTGIQIYSDDDYYIMHP